MEIYVETVWVYVGYLYFKILLGIVTKRGMLIIAVIDSKILTPDIEGFYPLFSLLPLFTIPELVYAHHMHGEGNGNPLQCSCLESPRDGGAWWAAIYGVAQSQTQLKQLSSSSSSSRMVKNQPGEDSN